MSLSVISTPLAAIAPQPSGTGGIGSGIPAGIDFSALLFGQIGALSELTGKQATEAAPDGEAEDEAEPGTDALALFLGNLQQTPPPPPRSPETGSDTSSGSRSDSLQPLTTGLSRGDQLAAAVQTDSTAGQDPETANLAADASNNSFADLLAGKTDSGTANAANSAQALNAQLHKTEAGQRAPTEAAVRTPVGNPGWNHEFGEKLVWMAKNDQQTAQININPPQLGPIQIHLSINGDQATATFASPFGEVRQAIESSLPQLKEMLASSGIDLGQTNVGANLAQQQREAQQQQGKARRDSDENAILPATGDHVTSGTVALGPVARGRGMVDLFA